jgi:hypothetical protein
MVRQRPILSAPFRGAFSRHQRAAPADLESWAEATIQLAHVNAGPAALITAFRIAATMPPGRDALARLTSLTRAAADICRRAGADATRASLDTRSALAVRFEAMTSGEEATWWRALARLAAEAPDCVEPLAQASAKLLDRCGAVQVEDFVAAGLRASRGPVQRLQFFALASIEARAVLDRLSGQITFARLQGQLRAYVAALWGRAYPLREAPPRADDFAPRRTTVSAGMILLPDAFSGPPRGHATTLYRASVAHASAHLEFGGAPFDPARLKPLQIVLVGLIEDARVETLALRRFPGLRELWSPFHEIEPSHLKTAPIILARLARGLIDPAYVDDDGIVAKGRALFEAEPDLADPTLSRRIGGLLGNDMGQMRIQFDARQHVVEPVYRDDNLGLWSLPPPPPDSAPQDIDVAVQRARIERRLDEGTASPAPDTGTGAGRARPVAPPDRGIAVARYPEWDRAAGLQRPDWVTLREVEPSHGRGLAIDDALARDPGLMRRVRRLVRNARVGRPTRLRRQPDGIELDVDAAIDAVLAMRAGELPEDRIHTRKVLRARDMAILVLMDASASTRDNVPAADAPVIEVEKLAVAVLALAMSSLDDRFALRAFASNGRDEVRVTRIKDFDRPFDGEAKERLDGLEPGYSTRLGAALRHAGAELATLPATRRILIVLTDGAPSDIDVADPLDLVEDARRAARGIFNQAIDLFGITLDPTGSGAGAAVFGRSNHMPVRRIEELPGRLSDLYSRIARR